jgi:hypothetical protein
MRSDSHLSGKPALIDDQVSLLGPRHAPTEG